MAGQLDVSLLLKAIDQGFTAELRGSQEELRDLGQQARATSSSMAVQTAAMGRASIGARNFRGAIGQAGFQLQDFVIQAAAGVPLMTAFGLQAGQLASAFGTYGVVIGTAITLIGVLGGALLRTRDDTESLADAQDLLSDTLATGAKSADQVKDAYDRLTVASQRLQ